MCVVSMVGGHWQDKFQDETYKWPISYPTVPGTPINPSPYQVSLAPTITREEFDALKAEVLEMKKLLIKAKIYDDLNNEPNCEMEDKVALLKKIAELVGVDLAEVFSTHK